MKWYQMYCQLILLLIKISACTVYFGLSECILSIPHLEHVLLLQKKRRKTIWSECRIVSPFKCKACEPPPNLRSALLDTLKNECFSITKMLNSKKMFNCNYFHTHFWILWGLFLNYVKIDQMVQDVKLFSLAAIFYIYLNGK